MADSSCPHMHAVAVGEKTARTSFLFNVFFLTEWDVSMMMYIRMSVSRFLLVLRQGDES